MNNKEKKDNLTDLIDEIQDIDGEDNNGVVTTPDGKPVKLNFDTVFEQFYEKLKSILKSKK